MTYREHKKTHSSLINRIRHIQNIGIRKREMKVLEWDNNIRKKIVTLEEVMEAAGYV
jgi:hypothetical protein